MAEGRDEWETICVLLARGIMKTNMASSVFVHWAWNKFCNYDLTICLCSAWNCVKATLFSIAQNVAWISTYGYKTRLCECVDAVVFCLLVSQDMVDDLLSTDGISKEYLMILKQIEDYCSRGPEIDLDLQRIANGNVSNLVLNQLSISAKT